VVVDMIGHIEGVVVVLREVAVDADSMRLNLFSYIVCHPSYHGMHSIHEITKKIISKNENETNEKKLVTGTRDASASRVPSVESIPGFSRALVVVASSFWF
jgi:hypothetical protein